MPSNRSRRALFGAGAAILLVGATEAGEAKAAHPDGELFGLIAAWRANSAESNALLAPFETTPAFDPRYKAAYEKHWTELSPASTSWPRPFRWPSPVYGPVKPPADAPKPKPKPSRKPAGGQEPPVTPCAIASPSDVTPY